MPASGWPPKLSKYTDWPAVPAKLYSAVALPGASVALTGVLARVPTAMGVAVDVSSRRKPNGDV